MLVNLIIKNYALIRELELTPSAGLNVVTGETGAGKSIMLGALGLLMGNRADTKALWDEQDKCITEGTFDIRAYKLKSFFKKHDLDYSDQTLLRREISSGGKSRAFINDTPVTLDVIRELSARLMNIHSQHETLLLGDERFQLRLIDAYAGNDALREQYTEAWQNYQQARKKFESLQGEADTIRQEADYINFQLDELIKANLQPDELEKLESEMKVAEHAEEIKSKFHALLEKLSRSDFAASNALREARHDLQSITPYSESYAKLFERLNSLTLELEDIVQELEDQETEIDFDPERANEVRERIDLINSLLKKHRLLKTNELLNLQEELATRAFQSANLDEALALAEKEQEQTWEHVAELAKKLSTTRKKTLEPLANNISNLLKELGIPNASFNIEHTLTEPQPSGADAIDILFSANKGIAPKPLAQVASGGEFSRVMFCIKYVMAEKTAMPTLILDEIDTGVSGEVAIKLGSLMKQMAKNHQVIAISHLPQIAGKAETHYFVFKDNSESKTISKIKRLSNDERVIEIAKMIGGENPTKTAVASAKELLIS